MRTTERITVSVPTETAEHLRRLADAGIIDSVSAYVAETIDNRVRRERDIARLDAALADRGIAITPEADAWVDDILAQHEGRRFAA